MIFLDVNKNPTFIMDADSFLRSTIFETKQANPIEFIHKPIVINDGNLKLGEIIHLLNFSAKHNENDVIDNDVILFWDNMKQIITRADILGKLLREIVNKQD